MKRLQSLTITLLSIAFVTAFVCERRAQRDLRTENQKLEHLIEQWTGINPAPKIEPDAESQIVSPSKEASYRELLRLRGEVALLRRQKEERDRLCAENQKLRSNLLARVLSYDSRLSSAQIESFLNTKGRTSESLLAASRLTD